MWNYFKFLYLFHNFNAPHYRAPGPVESPLALQRVSQRSVSEAEFGGFIVTDAVPPPANTDIKSDTARRIMLPVFSHLKAQSRDCKSRKCVLIGSRIRGRYSATLVTFYFSVLVMASLYSTPLTIICHCAPLPSPLTYTLEWKFLLPSFLFLGKRMTRSWWRDGREMSWLEYGRGCSNGIHLSIPLGNLHYIINRAGICHLYGNAPVMFA